MHVCILILNKFILVKAQDLTLIVYMQNIAIKVVWGVELRVTGVGIILSFQRWLRIPSTAVQPEHSLEYPLRAHQIGQSLELNRVIARRKSKFQKFLYIGLEVIKPFMLNLTENFQMLMKLKCWQLKIFLASKLSDVVSIMLIKLKCQQLMAF